MNTKIMQLTTMAIGILFCNGCATLLLTDNIPTAHAKGYVEFFNANRESFYSKWNGNSKNPFKLQITQLDQGKEVFVGDAGFLMRRRIACFPGTNTFFIKPDLCVKRVDVVVNNDMVTPVRVTYREVSSTNPGGRGLEIRLDADIVVGKPTSVREYDDQIKNPPPDSNNDSQYTFTTGHVWLYQYAIDSVVLAPAKSRQGYVRFYNGHPGSYFIVDAYGALFQPGAGIQYCDPKGTVTVRKQDSKNRWIKDRTVFACPTGTNDFLLVGESSDLKVPLKVIVKEGLLTPVRLEFEETKRDGSKIYFKVSAFGEEPRAPKVADGEW